MRPQSIRILGGTLRRRAIDVPAGLDVRPTSARAREALFNRLLHGGYGRDGGNILAGAVVADLCCGTGALAFEALSRGAASATLVDQDRRVMDLARANGEQLGIADACQFLTARLPAGIPAGPFDLVFADPPYSLDLSGPIAEALLAKGALAQNAVLCIEASSKSKLPVPAGYTMLDLHQYGAAQLMLLKPDR